MASSPRSASRAATCARRRHSWPAIARGRPPEEAESALAALEAGAAEQLEIERARLSLEHARRALEIEQRKLELLREDGLPRVERELEGAVAVAEGELEQARLARRIVELEGEERLREAEEALREP